MSTTSDTSPATGGTGIDNAAAAFERMLAPETARDPDDEAPEQKAEADEAEVLEADTSDETPEDEAEQAEDDGEDEEADADAEEAEQLDLPPDALVTVKVNGKEEQIPLKEAIAGYQRQADYSRKTAELAENRRVLEAEAQAIRIERAQYEALLPVLAEQLQTKLNAKTEADWQRLKLEDPLQYAIEREDWRAEQERAQAIQMEQQRLMQLRAMDEQRQLAQVVESERSKLVEAVPQFRDPKTWENARKQLREYGQRVGYSPDELGQAYDHRAVLTLWKAMQWDQMQSKQPVKRATVIEAKRPRAIAPGSANTPPRRVTETTRAKQRLAQTGRVTDAAKVFETLL